jgi:hypothetical protein
MRSNEEVEVIVKLERTEREERNGDRHWLADALVFNTEGTSIRQGSGDGRSVDLHRLGSWCDGGRRTSESTELLGVSNACQHYVVCDTIIAACFKRNNTTFHNYSEFAGNF